MNLMRVRSFEVVFHSDAFRGAVLVSRCMLLLRALICIFIIPLQVNWTFLLYSTYNNSVYHQRTYNGLKRTRTRTAIHQIAAQG